MYLMSNKPQSPKLKEHFNKIQILKVILIQTAVPEHAGYEHSTFLHPKYILKMH